MVLKKYFYFFFGTLSLVLCSLMQYENINLTNYDKLEYNQQLNQFTLEKKNRSYNINDGFFLSFDSEIKTPKHLTFKYKIPNKNLTPDSFEGCDVRVTGISKDQFDFRDKKTSNYDLLFFRVRHDNKINFNSLPVYIPYNLSNFGIRNRTQDRFIQVDIFFDWVKKESHLFLEGKGNWNVVSGIKNDSKPVKRSTDFYYEDELLMTNITYNNVILYNFSPNSSCIIKDLNLCNDFCNENIIEEFQRYLGTTFSNVNLNILFLIILIIVLP